MWYQRKKKVEEQGIDPCAFRMQTERSTIWATPPIEKEAGTPDPKRSRMRGSNPRLAG